MQIMLSLLGQLNDRSSSARQGREINKCDKTGHSFCHWNLVLHDSREASGWTHEIQTNHIPWETSGPLGATFQGHGQKLKGFILAKYAWKISLLHSPPPHQYHFPQAKQLIYWQDAANILWSLNHETRRGERDGDLMTANRRGRHSLPHQLPLWNAFVR